MHRRKHLITAMIYMAILYAKLLEMVVPAGAAPFLTVETPGSYLP